MSGASDQTERVHYVNANWTPGGDDGGAGRFELHVVTESGARHSVALAASEAAAVVALTQAGQVLLWDPTASTLIVANLVGEWFQRDWSRGQRRIAGPPSGA